MLKLLKANPLWDAKLACDDLEAAKLHAAAHKTYENLVNVQRLQRLVDEISREHRATMKVIK